MRYWLGLLRVKVKLKTKIENELLEIVVQNINVRERIFNL